MPKLALVISFLIASCQPSQSSNIDINSNSIQDAESAYFQMDHAAAHTIYTTVWNDQNQTLIDKTEAGRALAKMNWLFYQDNAAAHEILTKLITIDYDKSQSYILKARILADEERYNNAIAASRKALEISTSETEKYQAFLSISTYIFEKNKKKVLAGSSTSTSELDEFLNGYLILHELFETKPGDVNVANLYLGYSLLFRNGNVAFDAWMSYYRLTDTSQVHETLVQSIPSFQQALSNFNETTSESNDIELIIKALAESGFYEYAALLKADHFGKEPHSDDRINDIIFYESFLQDLDRITINFYLETLNGNESKANYRSEILKRSEELWNQMSWANSKPPFSNNAFTAEINNRFKAIMSFINANGYFGLHMGHIVLDDKRTITQYNESAEFRYISIDHMVSNGYSGWFWDGKAQTGGWASDDESFLQVRSAYTSGPIGAWQTVTDSTEIQKIEKEIGRLALADDSLAKLNPHAFLPGLNGRIMLNETKEILNSLKAKGLNGKELRLSFINEYERIVQGASIYAHEGRHSIDKKNRGTSQRSVNLEFTAKLSEVYFSEKPLFSFNAIMSRNLGDGTSHGDANLRVIKGLVQWMDDHKTEIAGFDLERPTLPQVDKLTDSQIKEAMKSMDPLGS